MTEFTEIKFDADVYNKLMTGSKKSVCPYITRQDCKNVACKLKHVTHKDIPDTKKDKLKSAHKDIPDTKKDKLKSAHKDIPDTNKEDKKEKTARTKIDRAILWNYYIGPNFTTKCMCCNKIDVTPFSFIAGHVVALSKGGTNGIENLRVVCSYCDKAMENMDMVVFMASNGYGPGKNWMGISTVL